MVRLTRDSTALLVVDIQERLLPVIDDGPAVCERAAIAIRGARALKLPILATEQYPKGLGATVPAITDALGETLPAESIPSKTSFSCCPVPSIDATLRETAPKTVMVAGIETHVCVSQTCLDLIDRGITPVVLADCTGSRHAHDHSIALSRLQHAGAVITSLEAALFELTVQAGSTEFKEISGLVKPL